MAKRELQPINAGSMADIAFLLLIFFLVTTTMDVDTGLMRGLPQLPDEDQQDQQDEIHDRNVFVVLINKDDELMVENMPMNVFNLREAAKEFIANPGNKSDLPELVEKDLPFFGRTMVTKNAVISLQNDRGTSYGMYIKVQNELIAAKNELRDEISQRQFGMKFADLDEARQEAVKDYYPSVLSEAEPKAIGGR
ncbi:MAG: biopolymer transporter ExbD [Bacteroidales bacterium]|nr:MAG: biopolymer transporter ExbD [Bacteroidales bacterium]